MKKLAAPNWLALFLFATITAAHADEKEIRKSLQGKFPNIDKIGHIVKTPYSGLYEIVVDDQVMYTDAQGKYLFEGSVTEIKSHRDLTEERRRQLFAIEFDKLPLDLAIKKVKGNGTRKLAYFSDPQCRYCKRLEKELAKITDVTLYLFMYPVFEGSDELVRNVYCAKNPVKAWDELLLDGTIPAKESCKIPTDKVLALGKKLRVRGTPNLIFGDGKQVPGFSPAEKLEEYLVEAGNK